MLKNDLDFVNRVPYPAGDRCSLPCHYIFRALPLTKRKRVGLPLSPTNVPSDWKSPYLSFTLFAVE